MPNPSASSPRHRSRQHIANTSAHAYSAGQVGVGDAAEEARRGPPAAPLEPAPVAARARDRELHAVVEPARPRRSPRRSPCAARAARRRARAAGRDRGRSGGGSRRASSASTGWNRSPSTPGGITTPGQRPPGGVDRAARRIRTRPRRPRPRRAARGAPSARLPGSARVAGDLAAVRDDDVRRGGEPRPDEAERQHRIEEDHVGAAPRARARRCRRDDAARREQHRRAHPLDPERLLRVPLGRVGERAW